MQAKLIAYSIVNIPPLPFKTTYAGGIAEDEDGKRSVEIGRASCRERV